MSNVRKLADSIASGKSKLSCQVPANNEGLYHKIRADCLKKGVLWEDPDFPADNTSLFNDPDSERPVSWKRPKEISSKPKLFDDGVSRFDVVQGDCGDCWVLAAVASLAMHKQLFDNVVPSDQDFESNYCGAFYFRFWQFGEWTEVIVDDRLPVNGKRLKYMCSSDSDEFWSALLEKAYAKANGTYDDLEGGSQSEAFEDFTGGTCQTIQFDKVKNIDHVFQSMLKALKKSSLMGCAIESDEIEGRLSNGLMTGHAYSVTDVQEINHQGKDVKLVRVRNPWGDTEWNGAWSDNSKELKGLSDAEKKKLNIVCDDDGEFWMSFADFTDNFTKVEICYLSSSSVSGDFDVSKKTKTKWELQTIQGKWVKNSTAGGCKNNKDTFHRNPQYFIEVTDPDPNDADDDGTLIVSLTQKDRRKKNLEFLSIGYCIYAVKPEAKNSVLDARFFNTNRMADRSPYINTRSSCEKHELKPGCYCIVPTTFRKNEEADFILRLLSTKTYQADEMDEQCAFVSDDASIRSYAKDSRDASRKEKIVKLHALFKGASGDSEFLNSLQLKTILDKTFANPKLDKVHQISFNKEACRSMVCLMDSSGDGKVEFDEFYDFYYCIKYWRQVFLEKDDDKSGNFTAFELRNALKSAGYQLSNSVFNNVVTRYSDPEDNRIDFEDWILLLIRIRSSFSIYAGIKKDEKGHLILDDSDFLANRLYM